jgi:hypothetical protein
MKINQNIIPLDRIESKIYFIRGKKVMFDSDLAKLYQVETGALNRAVKRNNERFPVDFMFQLNNLENRNLKCQIGTSSLDERSRCQIGILNRGQNIKYLPYVFTEEGVAMLSSVLKSERAIQVNIQIMRTFSKIREMVSSNKELREKIEKLEKKYEGHDKKFAAVFDAMRDLFTEKEKPKNEIGFNTK